MRDDLVARIARLSPGKRKLLERRLGARARDTADPVPREPRTGPLPTSFGQRRQWFLAQLDPANPTFNKMDAVRIRGALDVDALQRALRALVARHEVLRTHIEAHDGEPMQVIDAHAVLDVPVRAVRPGSAGHLPLDLRRQMAEDRLRPFDLVREIMYRAAVYRLGADDHVLTRTSHHIAFDKWSAAIANRELAELYAAAVGARPADLAPLPAQYADYAMWQRRALDAETLAAHVAFFTAHLAGAPQALELYTDHPRSAALAHAGGAYSTGIPERLVLAVRKIARSEGATPFMVLLAAFAALLHRIARQDEVLIGVPVAGRGRPEFEELIGLFMNTLVVRVDARGEPSFRELVARVRAASLGAIGHQELPFDRLVGDVAGPRQRNRTPLFQVMFDYINTPQADLRLDDVEMEPVEVTDDTAIYDLTMYVHDHGPSMRTVWEYRSDLFERTTVIRFAQAFETLLEAAVGDPVSPVATLPLLSPHEHAATAGLGTGRSRPDALRRTSLEMFDAQAARSAGSVAVRDTPDELTYADLSASVKRLSQHLRASGARPGDRVTLLLERSAQFVVAFLGVLTAGCVAVLLDPAHPPARLRRMLDTAGARLLLSAGPVSIEAADRMTRIDLLAEAAAIAACPPVAPPGLPDLDAPMYVVFTSGSTGSPKGVAIGHRAVANLVEDARERYNLAASDRVLQFAAPGFDAVVEEIFPTLCSGGQLVLRPRDLFASFDEFAAFVDAEAISVLDLPTAWWHAWVDEMARTGARVPPSVRLVIVGGEAALADRWRAWQRIAGDRVRWVNTYGPAEATVVAAAFEPPEEWAGPSGRTMPIGRPITNATLVVLDDAGQLLPPSIPGELAIEGVPVGLGYIGAEAGGFGDTAAPARRYRTGDLARMLDDGTFEHLGRLDTQVKIRGVRVEPGEVEAALLTHPAVRDAVVVAHDGAGGAALAAHVVADGPLLGVALRAHLAALLPEPMVPTAWHFHAALPLTASGKVDRRALSTVVAADAPAAAVLSPPPHSETERRLVTLWAGVLPQAPTGVHDDFFALGGHSLLGVRLISRVSEAFGIDLPLRTIFDRPTVAGMAEVIDARLRAPGAAEGNTA